MANTETAAPPGSGGAEGYNWVNPKQVVSRAFHHLCCLPLEQLPGTEFADRISQLLAKESTSAWPNWIEHTKDK